MRKAILFVFMFAVLTAKAGAQQQHYKSKAPYVVLLSLDAFRWDYPLLYHTPTLDSLAQVGVKAESLQPCFPSKTFPNHYTMATGLYPETHGIVQNSFTDPELGDYRLGDRSAVQNAAFYGGEPIWVSAEKQQLRSACFFLPGSEAPVKGYWPNIWKEYKSSVPFEARADSVVKWLERPAETRPHLILWYVHEPDRVGHHYGPRSTQTKEMVESLDKLVGDFCNKVNALPFADSINLIFTADHGMRAISSERAIVLNAIIDSSWITNVKGSNPVYALQPTNDSFADSIQFALAKEEHLTCWKKNELPKHLHYGNNARILDLVVAAEPGWSIYWDKIPYKGKGTHGYDPTDKDMHAIFYAAGPAFKHGYVQPSFRNTDLYVLLAKILQLTPVKTDGDLKNVEGMLIRR